MYNCATEDGMRMLIEAFFVNLKMLFFNLVITLLFLRPFNLNVRVFFDHQMLSSKSSFDLLSGQ